MTVLNHPLIRGDEEIESVKRSLRIRNKQGKSENKAMKIKDEKRRSGHRTKGKDIIQN